MIIEILAFSKTLGYSSVKTNKLLLKYRTVFVYIL